MVQVKPDGTTVLYVDRHFLHEATSAQAFQGLRTAGIAPWRHRANLAMPDHCVPTTAAAQVLPCWLAMCPDLGMPGAVWIESPMT